MTAGDLKEVPARNILMEPKREDEPAPQNESEKMNLLLRTIMESFEKPDLRGRAFATLKDLF